MIPIVGVTVHPDGALVRRAGRLPVGDGFVAVTGLPLLLDPASLRATAAGLREIRVELDVLGQHRGDESAPITELREASAELRRVAALLQGLREEREHAARIAPAFDPEGELPPPERLVAWAGLDDAIAPWVARLDEALRARTLEHERLQERIRILEWQIEQQSDEAAWRRWAPTRRALLRVDAEGEIDVDVSYRVRGATWTPAYVLDAEAALSSGRFAMRALVAQATGEDWSGVSLRLTTAPSRRAVDVPQLASLKLGARQPPAPSAWRDLPPDLDALFPAGLEAPPLPRSAPAPAPVLALQEEEAVDAPFELDEVGAADIEPEPMMTRSSRSSGLFGSLTSPAPAPPPPAAPKAAPAMAPQARHRKRASGAGRRAEASVELVLEVEADLLDYGRLRLRGWAAAAGQRGRLHPVADADVLAEAGLPQSAASRLQSCWRQLSGQADAVRDQPLPPHHVLPGPIGESDFRFDAAGAVDVPSDGRFHSVAVFTEPVKLDVGYRAVPRHDARAFRRVKATLDRAGALLPGPVDVYVGGSLELTTAWAGSRGRGALELGLGAEDRLKVARNVRYREEKAGLLGGSRRLHTAIEVEIASSLPRPVRVEILERVPVPAPSGGPTVEVTEASPIARAFEGEPEGPILKGARLQVLEVPPGGQGRAVLGYAVTLGAREELVGGDRRG